MKQIKIRPQQPKQPSKRARYTILAVLLVLIANRLVLRIVARTGVPGDSWASLALILVVLNAALVIFFRHVFSGIDLSGD